MLQDIQQMKKMVIKLDTIFLVQLLNQSQMWHFRLESHHLYDIILIASSSTTSNRISKLIRDRIEFVKSFWQNI